MEGFPNRYEGTTTQKVSALPLLQLIGFHAHRHHFKPVDRAVLHVTFHGRADALKTRITGRELIRKRFYWMESKPDKFTRSGGWNHFGPWPVQTILGPLNIGSDNLAVLVQLDGAGAIAPAFVRADTRPVSVGEYEAHFIAGERCQSVEYSLTGKKGLVTSGKRSTVPAEVPFTLVLSVAGQPAGPMRLEVTCIVSTQRVPRMYEFEHQPAAPAL